MSAVMPLRDEMADAACWQQNGLPGLSVCLPARQVAELAVRAAILEVAVSPKPGLV